VLRPMLCIGLFFCAAPGVASRYGATDHSAVAVRLLHAFVQFLGLEAEGGDPGSANPMTRNESANPAESRSGAHERQISPDRQAPSPGRETPRGVGSRVDLGEGKPGRRSCFHPQELGGEGMSTHRATALQFIRIVFCWYFKPSRHLSNQTNHPEKRHHLGLQTRTTPTSSSMTTIRAHTARMTSTLSSAISGLEPRSIPRILSRSRPGPAVSAAS